MPNGTNFTKATSNPVQAVDVSDWGGRVRAQYDSYSFTANPVDGEILAMARLPAGARIVGGWMRAPNMGTGGSFSVGWAGSSTALLAATDVSAAATFTRFNGGSVGAKRSDATDIIITLINGGTATSGTIELMVEYILD